MSQYAYSYDLFNSQFNEVEFESDNIDDEKIKKINKLKKENILHIFNNILSIDNYKLVSNFIDKDLTNSLIKNVIINDEKIINNKYYSKIKINYDKIKITEYLQQKKIPYVEYHPDKFLLIIYEDNKINDRLLTIKNNYYSFFKSNLNDNNFFQIPKLDINDRFILKIEDIKKRDINKINAFSKKYANTEVILVHVEEINSKINYQLVIYSNGKKYEKQYNIETIDYDNFFKILEINTLDIWKKLNQIQTTNLNLINCSVNYFNIFELKEIRKKLNNITLINNLIIKSLSYKKVKYDIYYYGNLNILKKIINFNQLYINNINESCEIRLR